MLQVVAKSDRLIDIRDVCRSFANASGGALLVLDDVNLTVQSGQIVGLLGRSGSGKSTLLRIIAGLVPPSSGEVRCRGEAVIGPPEGVSMVFQSFALFPWLTVLEKSSSGSKPKVWIARSAASGRWLRSIYRSRRIKSAYPKELSGGGRQRVGFARAFVVDPDILLMDQPFSALDVLTAETLRTDIIDLWIEGRLPIKSMLIVTHNIEEAVLMCDRVLVFSARPGRVTEEIKAPAASPQPAGSRVPAARRDRLCPDDTTRRARSARERYPGNGVGMIFNHARQTPCRPDRSCPAAPFNGHADLPVLAGKLQLKADEFFHLGKALQLLRLAQLSEGDLMLTESGKRFADLDTDPRKKLFSEKLVAYVPLIGLIRRVLDERASDTAPAARFRNELEDYMSEHNADENHPDPCVSWGRYARAVLPTTSKRSCSVSRIRNYPGRPVWEE